MIEIEVAKQIADIIFGYAQTENREADKPWLQDRRNEEINPYYRKTKQGLFLEMYYGVPGYIWTPLGSYSFAGSGSGSWDELMPGILLRLGATVHKSKWHDDMGEYGPIYAITGFGLPEAMEA